MKRLVALVSAIALVLTCTLSAAAEEAIVGPRNAFEYVSNFTRRCRIFTSEYGIPVKEPVGMYMAVPMSIIGENGYFAYNTPYGRLIINSEDYSVAKCNFTFMSFKNGEMVKSVDDIMAGLIALAALEYPDYADSIYDIDKNTKYSYGTMYDECFENFLLFMLDENKAEVEKEPFSYKLIFSGAYDYYLYYWKHDEDGTSYEYYDIMAVAPGYHAY